MAGPRPVGTSGSIHGADWDFPLGIPAELWCIALHTPSAPSAAFFLIFSSFLRFFSTFCFFYERPVRGWVGFVTNTRSRHWHGPPSHPLPPPNRLETRQENPNFLPYFLGQKELKLFELALEAPPAPDPAIWGISSGFWGVVQDLQYSVCTAIIAFSISPSGAAKMEVPGIWDIFPPYLWFKIKKKKSNLPIFYRIQPKTQPNLTYVHTAMSIHRDGTGAQGRCRCCPLCWETPNSSCWRLKSPFFPILSNFGCFSCCLPPTCSALPTQMELWEVVSMDPALLWPGKAP